ncbi:ImcF-related family protein [Rouxiella sp. WC2420]|uniref:ImcF-related family protein n=1 Tax=Rouxiella sp. WC2420 TaxID=3234145 RepID=A0AB39VQF1_9GAMM
MSTSGNWLGRTGRLALILAGIAVIWALINHYGPSIGITTATEKILTMTCACLLLAITRYFLSISLNVKEIYYRRKARQDHNLPQEESRLAQTAQHHETLTRLFLAQRDNYGRFWPRKVQILLLTGSTADVELLVPGLTSQLWQEGNRTILLWGGEPSTSLDSDWFNALRALRRRPLDGIVWVTSALTHYAKTEGGEPYQPILPDTMDAIAQGFSNLYQRLGWRLPLYVWSLQSIKDNDADRVTQSVGCLLPAGCNPQELGVRLAELVPTLIERGIQQVSDRTQHLFLLKLADLLAHRSGFIAEPLSALINPYRPSPLAGVIFSPASFNTKRSVKHHWQKDKRWDVLIDSLCSLPTGLAAKKRGFVWGKMLRIIIAAAMLLWAVGMVLSFTVNRHAVINSSAQVKLAANTIHSVSERLHAQLDVQKILDSLQYRQLKGSPWYSRFGLSQNDTLLTALWPHYEASGLPLIRDAVALHLEENLNFLARLPVAASPRDQPLQAAYQQLKLYLMLAQPEKMDASWFAKTLLINWPQRKDLTDDIWQDIAPPLLDFYARNLPYHPQWRLATDEEWVNQVQTLLVRQMGLLNSENSLYQKMLAKVAQQYVDMNLADMTGDTDAARIFTTASSMTAVPGEFTRKAWNEAVKPAIEKMSSDRREEMDWVLGENKNTFLEQDSPEALQSRLRDRYFADFSASWLKFLNGLHWQQAKTFSDAIDQLTLIADVRQSPLVALMNTLRMQGKTGQSSAAISDSLVKSAKNLLNRDEQPAIDQQSGERGPLDATFGPLISLMDGKTGTQGNIPLNLKTFLTRVTQVRLKLQQVVNAADPQAMTQTLAQTVFQGKAIDLTETRDYGSLLAASLGREWNGFGQTMFVQPMEQAWQQVLTPAAESLNAQWRAVIVDDWNNKFGGRYPFKNTASEVSLPLLGSYLNGESGRITRFLQTRLNGVLHKEGSHWVQDRINAQGLTFNLAFLKAIDTLSYLSEIVFINGEAKIHFELRPATAKDIMQTDLIVDNQKLSYYNQLPNWKRFSWPGDTQAPGASLSWISTQAGTRQYADLQGAWGLIRLLDKAEVTPYQGVNSSFHLRWKTHDGWPLNYTLRTETGEGPLALLQLRNFVLPSKIFSIGATEEGS